MKQFIVGRLLSFIPVIWGVATIVFLLMRILPGDPAAVMLAKSGASAEQIAQLRVELGLNDPIYVQYVNFLGAALRGDFGKSIFINRPVTAVLLEQIPSTIELAVAALLVSVIVGVLLGIGAAVSRGSWLDRFGILISVLGISMPMFWSGLLLILLFAVALHWLPSMGQGDLKHLILPTTVLSLACIGTITRTVRSSMIEVLGQEYISTARAKGLAERTVLLKHALRNSLIPVVTIIGLQLGWLLGGTVIVETIFSRRGLGTTLVEAILWKDFPLVQGGVLLTAVTYLVVNLVIDILYGFIDPRIRHA